MKPELQVRTHLELHGENSIEKAPPGVIYYREGKLPDIIQPQQVTINGDINTVQNFMAHRRAQAISANTTLADEASAPGHSTQRVVADRAIVFVNKEPEGNPNGATVAVCLDPENPLGAIVRGVLKVSKHVEKFKINKEGHLFKREELIKLFRFNSHLFDADKFSGLYDGLVRFKAQAAIESMQEGIHGNKGERANAFSKRIDRQGLPESFIINMPIFQGEPDEQFLVDLFVDIVDSQVVFWLESVGMAQALISRKDEIIDRQLSACEGIPVIYQ